MDHQAPWSEVLAIHMAFEEKLIEIAGNPLLAILTKPILDLTATISRRDDLFFGAMGMIRLGQTREA